MNDNTSPFLRVKLLLDADVLIHFFKADKLFDLPFIFKEYDYILFDLVRDELSQPAIRYAIDLLITKGSLILTEFPTSDELIDYEFDYLRYECSKGMGESACMAYAKYHAKRDGVVASSNLKDLLPYCRDNNIPYLTTLDFLCRAMELKIFSEADCDGFITKVLTKGSKLPVKRFRDYDCQQKKIIKYS